MGLVGRTSAKINVALFINEYKKVHTIWDSRSHTFIRLPVNALSEQGLVRLINDFNSLYEEFDTVTVQHVSYMLATAKIESYNYLTGVLFNPIAELGGDRYAEAMYDPILGRDERRRGIARGLGNIHQGDGVKYKGRGFVQITGKSNYVKFSRALGLDLENSPDLALTWDNAFSIMTVGMRDGLFTGYSLSDYLSEGTRNSGQDRERFLSRA